MSSYEIIENVISQQRSYKMYEFEVLQTQQLKTIKTKEVEVKCGKTVIEEHIEIELVAFLTKSISRVVLLFCIKCLAQDQKPFIIGYPHSNLLDIYIVFTYI